MTDLLQQEIARLRDELAETKRNATRQAESESKRSAISLALARAGVKDPNAVYAAIEGKITQHHDGRWVAEENGVSRFGPDEGATYSLDRLVADIAGETAKTEATTTAKPTVVLDPTKAGFNLSAAIIAAKSDPELHRELMARLAPRSMRF